MVIETAGAGERILRATVCEIERGVFYVTYPDSSSSTDMEECYQLGATAADAKRRIEQSARACGYETVIWIDGTVAPLFASCTGSHHPAGAAVADHRV